MNGGRNAKSQIEKTNSRLSQTLDILSTYERCNMTRVEFRRFINKVETILKTPQPSFGDDCYLGVCTALARRSGSSCQPTVDFQRYLSPSGENHCYFFGSQTALRLFE
jgi:hypothetical protein